MRRVKHDRMALLRLFHSNACSSFSKDGSIIICRRDVEIRNGEIGAFLIDDEAYVKRLKVTEAYVALMSDNPNYPPIFIGPGEKLTAVGKVIKVLSDI